VRLGFRSRRPKTQGRRTGSALGSATPRGRLKPVETTGSPKFLGNPDCFFARFSDAGRTACPPCHDGAAAWPPLRERRRLLHWDFRSSMAWLGSALSTLRRWSCLHATQDLLPGAGQPLLGGLGYPQGFDERFLISLTSLPPFPSFLGAIPFSFLDVRSAENQRPFVLQQNLYFRPLLQGQGSYGSVPG